MYDDGIGLDNHWSTFAVVNHTTTMTSLAFEYLATNDKCITFLHTCPGLVRTDIFARLTPPEGSSFLWRVALASIRGVVAVAMLLIGISIEESGERHAFHLTNDTHTPGVWLIDPSSELVFAPLALSDTVNVDGRRKSGSTPSRSSRKPSQWEMKVCLDKS